MIGNSSEILHGRLEARSAKLHDHNSLPNSSSYPLHMLKKACKTYLYWPGLYVTQPVAWLFFEEIKGNHLADSRIALAVVVGVLLGFVFSGLYPHGFTSAPTLANPHRRIANSNLQTGFTLQVNHQSGELKS
ncbi:hypothetical protein NC652_004883 [Populus alba x Populus x berolinensis]|nr:hypothetical protein NC652_004883 [Populus alba x Populus x berolinensis]